MSRTCIIFNPAARGDRAKARLRALQQIAREAEFMPTASAGDAVALAKDAAHAGFDTVVAAGGDGTINEVVNGLMWAPPGLRPRLGVAPIGTVNVYARELRLPLDIEAAWQVIAKGNVRRVDAGLVRSADGRRRYFAQLAGAGFDAMAIAALDLNLKRRITWLAYVVSGFEMLARRLPLLTVRADGDTATGHFVFIGKGSYYGGPFELFPDARLDDGRLTVCVFQGKRLLDVPRYIQGVLRGAHTSYPDVCCLRAKRVRVESNEPAPLELDGELWGNCPAEFSIEAGALQVLAP